MGFNLPEPKRKPTRATTMFEEANSEARSSTSEEEQEGEHQNIHMNEAETEEAQGHRAQLEFMQRYELTAQDRDKIKHAQPKCEKKKAEEGEHTQHNEETSQSQTDDSNGGVAAAASSSNAQANHPSRSQHGDGAPENNGPETEQDNHQETAINTTANVQERTAAIVRHEAAEVRRRRIQQERQEQEQARQVAQVYAISKAKDNDAAWRRDLLLFVAENFLDNVPEVKIFQNIEPKKDFDVEDYIRQLETEQQEELITQQPKRAKTETAKDKKKQLTDVQWETSHTQSK